MAASSIAPFGHRYFPFWNLANVNENIKSMHCHMLFAWSCQTCDNDSNVQSMPSVETDHSEDIYSLWTGIHGLSHCLRASLGPGQILPTSLSFYSDLLNGIELICMIHVNAKLLSNVGRGSRDCCATVQRLFSHFHKFCSKFGSRSKVVRQLGDCWTTFSMSRFTIKNLWKVVRSTMTSTFLGSHVT